jgi:hypothetical protein
VKEDRIIRAMKDLKEATSGDHLITIASKMTEAGTTGHTTIVCLPMEIAPIDLVRMITVMEETGGDITTMEAVEAMGNSTVMEVIIIAPHMVVTAPRMAMPAIMTVPTGMTNNALITVHASKDMTIGRPKPIPLLL